MRRASYEPREEHELHGMAIHVGGMMVAADDALQIGEGPIVVGRRTWATIREASSAEELMRRLSQVPIRRIAAFTPPEKGPDTP